MQSRLPEICGDFELESTDALPHLYMIGNDAIGLGAIAAGSQFMAAYPITPASEVMEYMIANISKVNGAVIQTEDEIAAVTWLLVQIMVESERLRLVLVQDGSNWVIWYD